MSGTLGTILIAALMVLMLYRRFKFLRMPHRVRPIRMTLRIAILSLLGGAMFLRPWASPSLLGGALALGAALGVYALTRVQFEQGERGRRVYRSNSIIGIIIFALFVARLIWRMTERLLLGPPPWVRRMADPDAVTAPEQMPLTFILMFVVIGYSVCYTAGVLIRSRMPQPA
jgi:hypothetical protein